MKTVLMKIVLVRIGRHVRSVLPQWPVPPSSKAAQTLKKAMSRTSIASKALPWARAVLLVKTAHQAAEIVADVLRDAVAVADRGDAVVPAAVAADAVRVVVVAADAAASRRVNCRKRGCAKARPLSSYALVPSITFVICSCQAPT
jgi:hypothetical protein